MGRKKKTKELKLLDVLPWTLLFIAGGYIAVNYALKTLNRSEKVSAVKSHKTDSRIRRSSSYPSRFSDESGGVSSSLSEKTKRGGEENISKTPHLSEKDRRAKGKLKEEKKHIFVRLYFCKENSDGSVSLTVEKRKILRKPSILTETIKELLKGPKSSSLMTCIPRGTRLISCSVSGGVAVLNLSSRFLYNPYGVEGYKWQLKQFVYTATQFDAVKGVRFKVNGKSVKYLGGEGVIIPDPATRGNI